MKRFLCAALVAALAPSAAAQFGAPQHASSLDRSFGVLMARGSGLTGTVGFPIYGRVGATTLGIAFGTASERSDLALGYTRTQFGDRYESNNGFNTFSIQFNSFPARQSTTSPLTARFGAAFALNVFGNQFEEGFVTVTPTAGVSRRVEISPTVALVPEISGGPTIVAVYGEGSDDPRLYASFGVAGSLVIGTGQTRIALTPALTSLDGRFTPTVGVSLLMGR